MAVPHAMLAVRLAMFAVWFYTSATEGQRNDTCSYSGMTYEDRAFRSQYFLDQQCTIYICSHGEWKAYAYGCSKDGHCYSKDRTIFSKCIVYLCTKHLNPLRFTFDYFTSFCCYWDGQTYSNGKNRYLHIGQNCTKWTCDRGNWTNHEQGCDVGGTCYPVGDTNFSNCSVLTCPKFSVTDKKPSQAVIHQTGCSSNGYCYSDGETVITKCAVYLCKRHLNPLRYSLEPQSRRVCCNLDDRNYTFGETITLRGVKECLKQRCDNGLWKTYELECEVEGACYPVGDTQLKNCSVLTCPKFVKRKSFFEIITLPVIKQTECNVEGTCYPVGDTNLKNCSVLTCPKFSNTGEIITPAVIKQTGCLSDGNCYSDGETFVSQCAVYLCKMLLNPLRFFPEYQSHKCCYWNGLNYTFGEIHPLPIDQKCTKWRCNDYGNWTNHEQECVVDGTCYPVGDTKFKSCSVVTCSEFSGTDTLPYQAVIKPRGCFRDGKCYSEGETVFSKCKIYVCTRHLNPFRYSFEHQTDVCCDWEGRNYTMGEIIASPNDLKKCTKWKCILGAWNKIEQKCDLGGTCYPMGDTKLKNCSVVTCVNKAPYQAVMKQKGCQVGDTCHPEGSVYYINVCERYVCKRTSEYTLEQKFQKESSCCYRGFKYSNGQSFCHPGESKCVKYRCSRGVVTLHEEGCERRGSCVPKYWTEVVNCKTYTCVGAGADRNKIRITRTRCPDIKGKCHEHGATGLVYRNKHGIVLHGCKCKASSDGAASINCSNTRRWNI